ncbi:hypothetical protein CGRA01v4_04696 [Colletotrichum graminicola]|nr:hypothetical protein CGRA01v4_04696 [Colletotrichum graminicola]
MHPQISTPPGVSVVTSPPGRPAEHERSTCGKVPWLTGARDRASRPCSRQCAAVSPLPPNTLYVPESWFMAPPHHHRRGSALYKYIPFPMISPRALRSRVPLRVISGRRETYLVEK